MIFWLLPLAVALTLAWLAHRFAAQVRSLLRFARTVIAEPELPPRVVPPAGELGRLQGAVQRMAEVLSQRLAMARAEERRLQAVLGSMVEGVLVVDRNGIVRLSNHSVRTLLELPPDAECMGRALIELTRHPDLHHLLRRVMQEPETGESFVEEMVLGGRQVVQVSATPIIGDEPVGQGFILVFHDITELKRLERMRRDFVANVSHELRTPLAAIRGYSETLLSGALDDPSRARQFLAIVERHAERLGRLVDDLLTLSDLELGRTELQRYAVATESVIEPVIEILRHRAESNGITMIQDVAVDTPAIDADPDRLEQALLNLVDNAIKYTPPGGRVTVSARVAGSDDGRSFGPRRPLIEIAVADTGMGVPPEDLPRLTERFYRVDKGRSRELGGTGLGLAIVKHIVHAHGGHLRIESELDRGTTVYIYMPIVDVAERQSRAG